MKNYQNQVIRTKLEQNMIQLFTTFFKIDSSSNFFNGVVYEAPVEIGSIDISLE